MKEKIIKLINMYTYDDDFNFISSSDWGKGYSCMLQKVIEDLKQILKDELYELKQFKYMGEEDEE